MFESATTSSTGAPAIATTGVSTKSARVTAIAQTASHRQPRSFRWTTTRGDGRRPPALTTKSQRPSSLVTTLPCEPRGPPLPPVGNVPDQVSAPGCGAVRREDGGGGGVCERV